MNRQHNNTPVIILSFIFIYGCCLYAQPNFFNYKRYLFGTPATLSLFIQSINTASGSLTINGGDSQAPSTPFTWEWGDGNVNSGFFPQSHTYSDITKNYILTVIANYSGGIKDSSEILIRFASPSINPIALSPDVAVIIPSDKVTLTTRLYPPPDLPPFNSSFFTLIPRSMLEYILSVASSVEKDFVNDNVFLFNSKFEQVMLRDSTNLGAYSIWYTNPVAFGVGDSFLKGSIGYSSLFHEMGHNYTLNSPGNFYYGGRIDGNANAIYSETMAQIFQHSAGYQIINNYQYYGLSEDLMFEIEQSVISSIGILRNGYENYLSSGMKFTSWNDPSTPVDETFGIFTTLAYKFCEQAENTGQGYRTPLKRMMNLLQGFNQSWFQRYDQNNNSAAADTFRATLMVAAISYGFAKDLRSDFRNLNFPISDQIYNELYNSVTPIPNDVIVNVGATTKEFSLCQNYPNPFNPTTVISWQFPPEADQPSAEAVGSFVTVKVYDVLGREVKTLINKIQGAGKHSVSFDASNFANGIYFYQLRAGNFISTKKMVILK